MGTLFVNMLFFLQIIQKENFAAFLVLVILIGIGYALGIGICKLWQYIFPKKEFSGEKAYKINLSVGNKLGEGQFGEVYKIKQRESGMLCAAKLFKIPS
jgi:hypothetical protein